MLETDKQIIGIYSIVETNGKKSLNEIEKQIDILKKQTVSKHSILYDFQCCDRD
jgi:hypothetical protein